MPDKENLGPGTGPSTTSALALASAGRGSSNSSNSNNNSGLLASATPSSTLKMTLELHPQRIVRFGENESDIFLVRPEDSARQQLVDKLKQDPTSAERWLALLRCPPSYEAKTFSKVRLLRRATTLIPKDKSRHLRAYLEIWILAAKLKETEKEARETFKYIKSERIGEREALFYDEYAAFEYRNGNHLEADEILSLGVRNGVYSTQEKETMYQRLAGNTRSDADSHRLLQTPREAKTQHLPRSISTPANSTPSTIARTPGSRTSSTTVSGFSSVRKPARTAEALLSTPSVSTRQPTAPQTTSRKAPSSASRFFNLSGPPLRVIASTSHGDATNPAAATGDGDDDADDDDDDDMSITDDGRNRPQVSKLSPIRESTMEGRSSVTRGTTPAPSARPSGTSTADLSYIRNWTPRPINAVTATSNGTSKAPSFDHHNRDIFPPSPKRQHLAPESNNQIRVDQSPISVGSVSSSTSSPQGSLQDGVARDPFASLTSKVVVNGLTYIKLEQIGSGGSSKVYRMLGPDLKIYALKKIKLKRLDPKSIEQYTNEIQLLKRLQGNPFIIRLIAAEQDLHQRAINVLMEHGEIDLGERLREMQGGLDENFLRVIWTQMLQAVHAIHRERIIHGDLKPANFLFVNGALKLIDFGIAKAISNDTTNIERDSQVGTVNFMSPEAIQGNAGPGGNRNPQGKMKVGRASDIWSLGCILYQIVYGKPPFADVPSIIEKFRCIIDPNYEIPFTPLKNKDLEDVMRKCLQRDHRTRPTIDGPNGLLEHRFLRNSSSAMPSISMSNASSVLDQMVDFLRAQGIESQQVAQFRSIGQRALGKASSVPPARGSGSSSASEDSGFIYRPTPDPYRYDTEERRTEI